VSGTVNPNGGNISDCHFDWGTSTAYGQSAPCSPSPGSGTSAVAVSAALGNLAPNTTYHFRVVATNAGGTSDGTDQTFATAAPPAGSPSPTTGAPIVHGSSGAGFSGTVNPNGLPTTVHFEYGLDARYMDGGMYASSTPDQQLAAGTTAQQVTATVNDLVPNALYHVRLVATNSVATVDGADQMFLTAKDPAPPTPTLGKTFNVVPTSGLVFIKLPGNQHPAADRITKGTGFIPLTEARQLPLGTQVDARQGALKLVAAAASSQHIGKTQSFTFSGGLFKINSQVKKGIDKGLTNLSLQEDIFPGSPSYKSCTAHAAADQLAHTAISRSILQTLHASGHGRFRTRGRYSAGTVRGTIWDTVDRCDGTLTIVRSGTVDVFDNTLRKTIAVHAHHSYLAKAPFKRKK
jgi:hypothetical protein